jgi:hypothetical protein
MNDKLYIYNKQYNLCINKLEPIIIQKKKKKLEIKEKKFLNKKTKNPNQINIEKDYEKETKKKGRKIKNSHEKSVHTKYSMDNLMCRIKSIIFDILMKYDNEIISKVYKNNLGNGIKIKQLLKINQSQIKNADVKFNKDLLNKTQGEILSDNITTRISSYPLTHNKNLINELLNEKDENKRYRFDKLFNRTLLECIKHIRGSDSIEGLEGLEKKLEEELSKSDEEEDYKEMFIYTLNHYESICNNKKSRKKSE